VKMTMIKKAYLYGTVNSLYISKSGVISKRVL
jgi:hypothetical protein